MDTLLFGAFPYVALFIFVIGTIYRYRHGFKYSSLSSQLLESEKLFPASVAFHSGIIIVFLGHLFAFLFPSVFSSFGGKALVFWETIGIIAGMLAILGLFFLFFRRHTYTRIKVVTNKMDTIIELLLLIQFILGVSIAIGSRWGISWFASDMTPYLYSIFSFHPDLSAVSVLPNLVKTHIFLAFLIILLIPFSRLVHFLVAPFHYITRPYQVVRWYWNPKTIRDTKTGWKDIKRPTNN
jgi:nitrate reductase gamma subunit